MGGREDGILRASQERGDPIPREIANRPELWSVCEPFWDAFWELNKSRPTVSTGMGATLGSLTYTDKSNYAKDHGFSESPDDLDDFLELIGVLDAEYLKLNAPRTSTRSRRT